MKFSMLMIAGLVVAVILLTMWQAIRWAQAQDQQASATSVKPVVVLTPDTAR